MAQSHLPSVALFALLTTLVLCVWRASRDEKELRRLEKERGCAPVRPWVSSLPLGLDLLVKAFWHGRNRTVCKFFLDISERSGPTHEQRLLGNRNVGTTSPLNLEVVLTKQSKDYNLGFRIPQFRDVVGHSVFTQEGASWQHSRDLLRPIFSSNRYSGFEDIQRCVENMLDDIAPAAVVDLQPLFFQLTLETTLFMLFGDSAHRMISSGEGRVRLNLANALNEAQEYLAYRTRVGDLHWLINGPGMWRACRTIHSFVDSAIKEALEHSDERHNHDGGRKKRYVFVDALIERTQDPAVLRDQCTSLLIAGRDTTAACLSWTMRLLARRPEALAKVREDIASVAGLGPDARQPSREDLKQMTYLGLAIKESLRLYPPVPVNQRAATRTTVLPEGGGSDGRSRVLVREGESVGFLTYAMHRRKDIYGEDAEDFRPERWQDDALRGVGYGYLPFGAGQRSCLGQEFAMLEATYTIARLIQRFPFVTVPDGETLEIGEEKQLLTLVVSSAEGCRLRLS